MPDVDALLRRFFHRKELEIKEIVTELPDFTPNQVNCIKICLDGIRRQDGYAQVGRELMDRVLEGRPVSMFEMRRLIGAVKLARRKNLFAYTEHLRQPGDNEVYWSFLEVLWGIWDRMLEDKRQQKRLSSLIYEQDVASFQRQMILISAVAAVFSAVAALASCTVTYWQYQTSLQQAKAESTRPK